MIVCATGFAISFLPVHFSGFLIHCFLTGGSLFSSNRRVVVNIEALVLIFASDAGVETSTGHGCIDSM